jgi:hypothetical protein
LIFISPEPAVGIIKRVGRRPEIVAAPVSPAPEREDINKKGRLSSLFAVKSDIAGDFSVFFASSPSFPSYLDSLSSRSRKVHSVAPFRSSRRRKPFDVEILFDCQVA